MTVEELAQAVDTMRARLLLVQRKLEAGEVEAALREGEMAVAEFQAKVLEAASKGLDSE